MRKPLVNLSASSFICWSIGVIGLWIERDRTAWIGFVILAVGVLLFLVAVILFILRSILLDRSLSKRGVNLSFLDLFRRVKRAEAYQRDIWLRATVGLSLPVFVLFGLLSYLVIQNNFITFLSVQNQQYLGACVLATICLVFPLSMFLYALVSADIGDILNKIEREKIPKQ
jgi:hypothetical protein